MTLAERLIQKGFDEGFKEGFKQGFKQGALEVAREIACRLRDIGWPPERIQEVTGLSGEELKSCFLMSSSLAFCQAVNHAHTSSAVSPSSFSRRLMISALRIPCM